MTISLAPISRAMPMDNLERRTFIVMSTAHLTEQTARHLDTTSVKDWPCIGGPYGQYGWFVYAHEENCGAGPEPIPDDLFNVMTWARKQGVEYILFDCDAAVLDDLPSHHW